jgi:DnaJ-class molecular chaperone
MWVQGSKRESTAQSGAHQQTIGEVMRRVECEYCHGSGTPTDEVRDYMRYCGHCQGSGEVPVDLGHIYDLLLELVNKES